MTAHHALSSKGSLFVKTLTNLIRPHRKAIAAAVAAGVAAAWPLVVGDHNLSADDVYIILGALVAGAGLTWLAPANVPKDA